MQSSLPNHSPSDDRNFRFHRCPAFSLIELMVVLVIIGIVTAVIVVEMKGTFEGSLLRANCRKLVAVIGIAGSQAVSRNQDHRLHIDTANGKFFIERTQRETGKDGGLLQTRDIPDGEGEFDRRITLAISDSARMEEEERAAEEATPTSAAHDVITFHPDGTADAKDILLKDRQGFQIALRINPATARVQIIELDRQ